MVAWESVEFTSNTAGNDDYFFDDDYDESSAESVVSDGIDPLLGTRISTSAGPGIVDEIREYEDMQYCIVRLDTFGTVNMLSKSAQALLRKERKLSPQKGLRSGDSARQGHNVKGYIRMYNPAKGWGFIVCEEFEGDIFLHSKHMISHAPREYIGHFHSNQEGHQVRFDLDLQHKSRPQALNVRLLNEAEQPAPAPALPKKKLTRPVGKGGASVGAAAAGEEASGRLMDADNDPSSTVLSVANDAVWPEVAAQGGIEEGVGDPSSETDPSEGTGLWTGTGPVPARVAQKRGILRMRGLPFTATTSDVAQFFDGFGVRPEDVTLSTKAGGLTNGEAHVQFAREELAARALKERNMSNMGHRYIELFPTKVGSETKEGTAPVSSSATSDFQAGRPQHVAGQQLAVQELPPGPAPPAPKGIAAAAGPSPAPTQPSTAPPPYAPGMVSGPTLAQPASPGLQNMQAVLAGAAAPTPAVAAAATYAAQHAAAAHSAQVVQAPGLGADGQEAAYAQNQQMMFQHYFQQYQQAYAAAAASQAVQAAAAAAAQQAAAQQFPPQPGQQQPLPPYDYGAASAPSSAAATATAPSDGASAAALTSSTNQPPEAGATWPTAAAAGSADAAAAGVQSQGGWHSTPVATSPEAGMVQGVWQGASAAPPNTAGWWGTTEDRLPSQPMVAPPAPADSEPPSMPTASAAAPAASVSAAPPPGYSDPRPQYYNEI
mmetsp:Transcript_101351/g.194314  ORF Transcript_101351/g.194314 Transcript_101351/m.194314 type:complete len:716 (-) Transcript_101351:266-2413(-)